MKCIYKAPNNFCLKHSTEGTIEFCVEGPCPDEVMAEELDRQYHDFRRGVSDWAQYFSELKAANARCEMLSKMVTQYQDELIPGYRERAEKAERERRAVLERLGEFGRLFIDYVGCPRGAMGRQCAPLTEELLSMPVITDVDGGRWRPVNEDALQEAVALLKERQ